MRELTIWLLLCGLSLTTATATQRSTEEARGRPNIILIVADDQGYKLYHDGAFYDFRRDPLEQSPLAQAIHTSAQEQSRRKLQQAL